jgi:glutamate dehydrogenase/leucine dehydrogenase
MTEPFAFIDELGPEKVIHMHDTSTGLRAILVVDNVSAGPAIGGSRMATDVSLDECFRLARAMTLKNAAAGLAHGGGKSVIFADPTMPVDEKERLIRSFAHAIKDVQDYIVGPDMGTNETCMAWCHNVTGRAVGLPREIGGIPLDEIGATGYGLAISIERATRFCDVTLEGARVVVQGFGAVGSHAARFLADRGAVLVGAADIDGGLFNPEGIDVAELIRFKREGASVAGFQGGEAIGREDVLDIECDIWIPAARPDVITVDNADRLKTSIVAQGANIPASAEAEAMLEARGVVVLPDFVANAGGVICAAVEYHGGSESQAFYTIEDKIGNNTKTMLSRAREAGITAREAAMEIAEERVRQAMAYRKTY